MEESSDEDLDYFAALDVAAAEPSPRAEGSEELPGASTGYRRRRAVAKRRVSELSRSGRRYRSEVERVGFVWMGLVNENYCPRRLG
jgi:hypothetical protein